jgi:hypothetical protein
MIRTFHICSMHVHLYAIGLYNLGSTTPICKHFLSISVFKKKKLEKVCPGQLLNS